MTFKKHISIFFIIILLFAASSCAKKTPVYQPKRIKGSVTERSKLLQNNIQKFIEVTNSVKALVSAELYNAEEFRETDAALVIKRPESIRADAIDQLADVWASLGTDGKKVWLSLPSKSKLYSGRASKKNLHKLAKFDWEMNELASVLLGSCPIADGENIYEEDGQFVSESGIYIWTNPKMAPIRCVRYKNDHSEVEFEAKFSELKREGKVLFPHRVEAIFPARESKIIVDYKNVSLGDAIDDDVFLPPKNNGTKVKLEN